MEIRALKESDDRAGFRSGDPDLDRFLVKYAGQNQFRHHIGITYVVADKNAILGYATVAAGAIEIDRLPAARQKKLPRYPLPILRLGRLAVAEAAQGRGVGKALLRFVFQLALRMAPELGCVGVSSMPSPEPSPSMKPLASSRWTSLKVTRERGRSRRRCSLR